MDSVITVFCARDIITMEPMLPRATSVAVQDGIILSVGTREEMEPWLRGKKYVINDDFRDHILMPGFIDTHVHPLLGGLICASKFLTPFSWNFPWETIPALETPAAYHHAFAAWIQEESKKLPLVLMTWGYHERWHGPLSKQDLDRFTTEIPLVVWQFSAHEFFVNSRALEEMQLPDTVPAGIDPAHVDREHGHFFETGAFFAGPFLRKLVHNTTSFQQGMDRFLRVAHAGGITTMADMATGLLYGIDEEVAVLCGAYNKKPLRLIVTPDIKQLSSKIKNTDALLTELKRVMQLPCCDHVSFGQHVKLFADGAFFSERMQMGPPGFIDGHCGAWIMEPDEFRRYSELMWRAGYQIHVHANGDQGIEMVLDTVAELQTAYPRVDHRWTIEHCGYATSDQIRRCAVLGILVSAQVYYVYTLFPLAPLQPLFLAHIAHTRMTKQAIVRGPEECLTIDQALRAVTIDAAYILRLEHTIGSIRAGKKADFVVLGQDPYAFNGAVLKDISVWGTIMNGIPYCVEVV